MLNECKATQTIPGRHISYGNTDLKMNPGDVMWQWLELGNRDEN